MCKEGSSNEDNIDMETQHSNYCLIVISYECVLIIFKTFNGYSYSKFLINYISTFSCEGLRRNN